MRITHLDIKNFGPIAACALELAPVNCLIGPNEQGKSFILKALEVLKTGTACGLDVQDNKELSRDGSEGWELGAQVDGVWVKRSRSGLLKGSGPMPGEARAFRAVLEAGHFFGMDAAGRRELVASMTARPVEELAKELTDLGATPEILEAIRAGNFRRAYRLAEEKRRDIDRAALKDQDLATHEVDDVDVAVKGGTTRKVSTIAAEAVAVGVGKAKKALEDLLAANGTAESRRKKNLVATWAHDELKRLGTPSKWTDADEKELEGEERSVRSCKELAAVALATRNDKQAAGVRMKAVIDSGDKCCTCGQDLTDAARARAQKEASEYAQRATSAHADWKKNTASAEEHEEKAALLRDRKRISATETKDYADLEVKAAYVADDAAADEAEKKARDDVARLETIAKARETYDAAVAAKAAAAESLKASAEVSVRWRQVVEKCRPDRIEDEGRAICALNELLEPAGRALLGGEESASIGGQTVAIMPSSWEPRIEGRRPSLASDSASLRASFACSVALAQLSGLKILVLDRLEALVGPSREAVLKLCKDLVQKKAVDTVFLCSASAEEKPGPKRDWLAWWWVAGGAVKKL